MADTPDPNQKWSLRRKLVLGFLLPIALLLGILLTLDGVAGAKFSAAMQEARQIGGPVTFAEMLAARKRWPDGENGAEVINKLKDRLLELSKPDGQLWELDARISAPLGRALTPEQDRAVADLLANLSSELSAIDQLRQFAGGNFPITLAANPTDTQFPQLQLVRSSAKLKAAQARYRAMHGDTSHAMEDVDIILRHAELLADEPTIVGGLVQVACQGLAVDTLQDICALSTLSADQLAQLQGAMATAQSPNRLVWGMRGERAMFLETADWFRQQGLPTEDRNGAESERSPTIWLGVLPGVRGLLSRDQAAGLHLQNLLVAAAGDRRKAMQNAKEISDGVEQLPTYAVVSHLFTHSMERAFILDGHLEAELRSATIGLAAERYRLDHRRFPTQLEVLVPEYIEQLPLDPFTDQPLRVRYFDGALLIYSVGEDQTDDGGAMEGWTGRRPSSDWGFILLPPERRGLPCTQPATGPGEDLPVESPEDKAERLRRFREGGR